ncbi:MAG: hypothetical protein ABIA97_06880 [Candidatus Omnitrophota bacterium]
MSKISDLLEGLIGRPVLFLIKWLRWCFLFFGLYFNTIEVYDPIAKKFISSQFTIGPFILGLILFCVGLAVKRYDECYKVYMRWRLLDKDYVENHFK